MNWQGIVGPLIGIAGWLSSACSRKRKYWAVDAAHSASTPETRHLAADNDQTVGMGKGQRINEDPLDRGVQGHCRTDAKTENKHGDGGEARAACETAGGLATVDQPAAEHCCSTRRRLRARWYPSCEGDTTGVAGSSGADPRRGSDQVPSAMHAYGVSCVAK